MINNLAVAASVGGGCGAGAMGVGYGAGAGGGDPDCQEVICLSDSQAEPAPAAKKKVRKNDARRRYQDSWASKYPWAEQMPCEGDNVEIVRCSICTKVNGAPKILIAKGDNLAKHQGWEKAKSDLPDGTK